MIIQTAQSPLPVSGYVDLFSVNGEPLSLGQKPSAESLPVVFANDQPTLEISGVVFAVPSGTYFVEGPVTDDELRASPINVLVASGNIIVDNFPATQDVVITSPLRTARVDAADTYTEMEALEDQEGADGVLTFTFASAVQLVWVRSVGGISRAIIGSQTPTETLGVFCADDEPTPIVVNGTVVKVFAPLGADVSIYGCRYT